mmetsp:Transcript_85227/g.260531  ORF Transcript_85227/g.260531 Transcript_85227/m.260531 type:complete len:221 (-) Transcript_85227:1027-1689(-)
MRYSRPWLAAESTSTSWLSGGIASAWAQRRGLCRRRPGRPTARASASSSSVRASGRRSAAGRCARSRRRASRSRGATAPPPRAGRASPSSPTWSRSGPRWTISPRTSSCAARWAASTPWRSGGRANGLAPRSSWACRPAAQACRRACLWCWPTAPMTRSSPWRARSSRRWRRRPARTRACCTTRPTAGACPRATCRAWGMRTRWNRCCSTTACRAWSIAR